MRIHRHRVSLLLAALVMANASSAKNVEAQATENDAQTTKVRGAHEGMAPGEKTDDLGITVPFAAVHVPPRRYPASDEFPTGPAIGEKLPEFKLPNQDGQLVDFHADRGDAKAIVVFYRSVVW